MPGEKWTWTDGTTTDFIDWALKEPKNITGTNCATLSLTDGLWRADDYFSIKALHYMAYDFVWTGAFSNDNGKTWKWSDNTKWDFNPWMTGYPSIKTSAYGKLWGGGLQDDRGSNKYRIVCKKQL
uniref:C-type lectin domain-containing protein n=1 Tax=Panagrolaimus sp. ES5 TaxID=591445 RepID=A0AC34FQR2_9BILA